MKIYKRKLYRLTYINTGGQDVFIGEWILSYKQAWLLEMINNGTAKAEIIKRV